MDNRKSDTRAIPAADPNNRLEYMKAIVQTANVEAETIPLREVIPFWFAVSSPLLGALWAYWEHGLLPGSACDDFPNPDALTHREEITRSRFLPTGGRH